MRFDEEKPSDGIMSEPIASLEMHGLSARTINMLEDNFDAVYIADLQRIRQEGLCLCKQFGQRTVEEIRESLRRFLLAEREE